MAQQSALKKAMAANPKNKATQKLGASALASTNSKLSSVKSKVEQVQKYKNASKPASSNDSQIRNRAQYLLNFGQTKQTPINTVNGRPSSTQLVRDKRGTTFAANQTGFTGTGQLINKEGRQYVLDPSTGEAYDPRSSFGKGLLGAKGMNSADFERSLRASERAALGQNATTGAQMSYADIGRGLIQNEYDATSEASKKLGLGETYSSLEAYLKDQAAAQAEQKALQEQQLTSQETIAGLDQSQASKQAKTQFAVANVGLSPSREGVTSLTNLKTIDRLRGSRDEQLQRIDLAYQDQLAQIEVARSQLARAEKAGNTELAQQYRSQLAAAEMQAKAIDTEYMTALTQQLGAESDYAKTQSAIKQSGIQTFQGLVESGVAMDYNTVAGYAAQLDLPTDLLMGYYQGAEVIRNDKTLDQETKAVQIAQLNQDLQDQMDGLTTESARKVDYLNKQTAQWQALGMSESEIAEARSNLRTMLGIEDQSDPAYLADLAYKEAQIKYAESNTAVNYQDMLTKQLDFAKSMGYEGGAYIPNSTRGNKYKIQTVTSEDGSIGVQVTNSKGQILEEGDYGGQCGAFVNDLFGASVFGDYYGDPDNLKPTDKLAQVDFSLTMPAAGMAIVLPQKGAYAKNGHVVYITSVDAVNQQINYVDSNGNGDETVGYNSMTFGELGQLIQNKTGGLVVNDNATLEGGAMGGAIASATYGTDKFLENSLMSSKGGAKVDVASNQGLLKSMQAVNQIDMLMNSMDFSKDVNGNDSGVDASPLTGWIRSKNPWDSNAQEVQAILQGTVPIVARGIFGEVGVLTDADVKLYQQVLPNLKQTDQVKTFVTSALLKTVQQGMYDRLNLLAQTGYDVSGLYPTYKALSEKVSSLENALGIQGGSDQEAADQQLQDWMDLYDNSNILNEFDSVWGQ